MTPSLYCRRSRGVFAAAGAAAARAISSSKGPQRLLRCRLVPPPREAARRTLLPNSNNSAFGAARRSFSDKPAVAASSGGGGGLSGLWQRLTSFAVGAGLASLVSQYYLFGELREANKLMLKKHKEMENRVLDLEVKRK